LGYQAFPVRVRFRKATDSVRYWYLDHYRGVSVFLALWAVALAGALVLAALLAPQGDPLTSLIPSQPVQRELEFTNVPGGYGFSYPSNWDIRQAGTYTELESPNGDTVLSFRRTGGPWGEDTSTDLLGWMTESLYSPVVLGTTRERIAGIQSFLLSGTGRDLVGRRVRFLAIALPGQRPRHLISIVVPADSDPSSMLERVEAIVTSFEILSDGKTSQTDADDG
jgi:hypothetical protein